LKGLNPWSTFQNFKSRSRICKTNNLKLWKVLTLDVHFKLLRVRGSDQTHSCFLHNVHFPTNYLTNHLIQETYQSFLSFSQLYIMRISYLSKTCLRVLFLWIDLTLFAYLSLPTTTSFLLFSLVLSVLKSPTRHHIYSICDSSS